MTRRSHIRASVVGPGGSSFFEDYVATSTRRTRYWFAISLVLLFAVAFLGLWKERVSSRAQEANNAQHLAENMQVHVSEILAQTQLSLQGVQADLSLHGDTPPQQLSHLRSAMRYDPATAILGVMSASGSALAVDKTGAPVGLPGHVLKVLQEMSKDGLALAPALQLSQDGDWYLPVRLQLSSAATGPAAAFGLVSAKHLVGSSAGLRLVPGGYVGFANKQGQRLFRYNEDTNAVSVVTAPIAASAMARFKQGGSGYFVMPSSVDNINTLYGYSVSSKLPLLAVVGVRVDTLDKAWFKRSAGQVALLVLAAGGAIYFALKLRAYGERLARSQAVYQGLFASVGEGMLIVDSCCRILVCNEAASRMLGASADHSLQGLDLAYLMKDSGPALQLINLGPDESTDVTLPRLDGSGDVDVEVRRSDVSSHDTSLSTLVLRDVGKERRHLQEQEYLASHDSLTGLLNRYAFQREVQRCIDQGKSSLAVVLLDLNRFKEVNDTLGHFAGDKVLEVIGQRLEALFKTRPGFVGRLGGDEIAVCAELPHSAALDDLCREIQTLVGRELTVDNVQLELTASLGAALHPDDADNPMDLLRCADIAMYVAKREMRSHQRYCETQDHFTAESLALKVDFARAIRESGLALVYQPKIDLATGALAGAEALSRWTHPTKGPISPGVFVPLAETTELIHPFTEAVLNEGLAQCSRWLAMGHEIPMAVNISANNLMGNGFTELVRTLLAKHQVPAHLLELEVTESALMMNPEAALRRLHELRALGVKLAIDDFGTGFASLAYLKRLPVTALKIDQTFIAALTTDNADQRIVSSTIQLAHSFDMTVVAEGVETEEAATFLRHKGCDIGQGYHFARPLSAADFARQWLTADRLPSSAQSTIRMA